MNIDQLRKLLATPEFYFHLGFWVIYFAAINVDWSDNWFDISKRPNFMSQFSILMFPIIFYANAIFLIPKFLKRRQWLKYLAYTILLVLLIEVFRVLVYIIFQKDHELNLTNMILEMRSMDNIITGNFSPALISLQFSFAYRFTRDWIVNNSLIKELKEENTRMELNFLKAQINPHFLFNSLNSLENMIDDSPKMAKNYLYALSNIYRYLISSTQNDVIGLDEEYTFLKDYIFLVESRFGNAYEFIMANTLNEPMSNFLIPPASLHCLVENIIKHNSGDHNYPLQAKINFSSEGILVENIKRPKINSPENSLKTGLNNIKKRMQLLSDNDIVITESASKFKVVLPLIRIK